MSEVSLVRVRLQNGRYVGFLTAPSPMQITAMLDGEPIAAATVEAEEAREGTFRVQMDMPASVIGSGVRVISLVETDSGTVLDRITLMAGEALDDDIRAEVALLREELELLKRAVRHAGTAS